MLSRGTHVEKRFRGVPRCPVALVFSWRASASLVRPEGAPRYSSASSVAATSASNTGVAVDGRIVRAMRARDSIASVSRSDASGRPSSAAPCRPRSGRSYHEVDPLGRVCRGFRCSLCPGGEDGELIDSESRCAGRGGR